MVAWTPALGSGAMCAMQGRAIQDQLGGDNYCFGCGPQNPDGLQIKSYWEGEETVCRFEARPAFAAGPRQLLNGGIIATLIDCHSVCTAMALAYRAEGRPPGARCRPYFAALIRWKWVERPAPSPGYTQSPTTLGLTMTSFANQRSGMSANSSKR